MPAGTHGPLCESTRRKLHSGIQAKPNTRPSLRSGLTAYACSPRSRVPSGLRHLANWRCLKTRLSLEASPQGLTVATTVRTTRFCRTRRPGFALVASPDTAPSVRTPAKTSRGSSRPGLTSRARRSRVHRTPIHVRYDVRSPLSGDRDGVRMPQIRISVKRNIFAGGIDGFWREGGVLPDGSEALRPISAFGCPLRKGAVTLYVDP